MTGLVSCFSDFYRFMHPTLGVCHTFNSAKKDDRDHRRKLRRAGPASGFVGVFFIAQEENIGELAQKAGMRLVIHEPNRMPFPTQEGVALAPGQEILIGIRKVFRLVTNHE